MTEVMKHDHHKLAIARRDAVNRLQRDIKLSLGQKQNLPDMLMTAPLAINLLGQIKLLAFSDDALRIRLTEPQGGFQHLQRTSLSAAMIQIVDQSAGAFDSAEKNMRRIRLQANVMFGKNGRVQAIFACLQDPRMAKKNLLGSMAKFQSDMEDCAEWAKDTEAQFDALVRCAQEVNLAMSDEMTSTAEKQEQMRREEMKTKAASEIQNSAINVLKARVKDAATEFREARSQYQKENSKSEISAMASAAALGLGSSFNGLINATIGVFRETTRAAVEVVKVAGEVGKMAISHRRQASPSGGPGTRVTTANEHDGSATNQPPTVGIDPALLAAEELETQLSNLYCLLCGDSLWLVEGGGGSEISGYDRRFEAIEKGLGDFKSSHVLNARAILDEARSVVAAVLEDDSEMRKGGKDAGWWDMRLGRRQRRVKDLQHRATKLRSFAASQPGQGFAGSLDVPVQTSRPGDSAYTKIMRQRHQKLFITRIAMNDARSNLEKTAEMQQQVQAQIVEIARALKEFEHKGATLEDTKKILRRAMDAMVAFQDQVRQLTDFFNVIASIISVVCKSHAEQYLQTIEEGVDRGNGGGADIFAIAYSEQQLRIIRETLVTLRGHFSFVVSSTSLYQEIATAHINPCIRMAANLPLSVSPAQQDLAKQQLKDATDKSSEAIKMLAQKQMEAYHNELDKRVSEIEDEMAALGLPPSELADEEENLRAVEEGVKEAGDEIAEDAKWAADLFEDITADIWRHNV
ncbi:hypothetical protein QBC42DRAFT_305028 [Cladorrhinum samala]|uniref:Uncharacterized protein n=1 Tax=Cladorrhinum samala TaxID=585594 RepID=A0AAV9HTV3_9PEZI|nr:hypothetical protein QBC42DRAFT_305028 [Cladorrhinum samala]